MASVIPGSFWRVKLLRLFGASIGRNVIIKPRVRVKDPRNLIIDNNCWLGEGLWIDNLDKVSIGSNVCVSQSVYICTGSHDWTSNRFELVTKPILIHDCAWICARASLAPGTCIGVGAVIGFGVTFTGVAKDWTIYSNEPRGYREKKRHVV